MPKIALRPIFLAAALLYNTEYQNVPLALQLSSSCTFMHLFPAVVLGPALAVWLNDRDYLQTNPINFNKDLEDIDELLLAYH